LATDLPGRFARALAAAGLAAVAILQFDDRRHRILRDSLGVFVLDRLDARDHANVQAHLDRCSTCRSEVEQMEPVARAMRATPVLPRMGQPSRSPVNVPSGYTTTASPRRSADNASSYTPS
jgi:anti-sigma factor RsiW